MNTDNIIKDIDTLIDISRYFIYDSEKEYNEAIEKLLKLRKLVEEGRIDKYLKNGCDDDDS